MIGALVVLTLLAPPRPSPSPRAATAAETSVTPPAPGDGYGALRWGASRGDVRKRVAGVRTAGDRLVVPQRTLERPAQVEYAFAADRLAAVSIVFTDTFPDASGSILEYERIHDALDAAWKTSGDVRSDWTDDELRDDAKDRGAAVAAGHLALRTLWDGRATKVTLACAAEDSGVTVRLSYVSKPAPAPSATPAPRRR